MLKASPFLLQAQVDNVLAGHVSDPADVAELYLSGLDSNHMTGQTS